QNVVLEGQAKEARHLRRIGTARRHKERGQLIDLLPVPIDLTTLLWQQSQQHTQQRRFPRADPSSNDGELAPLKTQMNILNATLRTWIAIAQMLGNQLLQSMLIAL